MQCATARWAFATLTTGVLLVAGCVTGCASSPQLIWDYPGYHAWATQHGKDPSRVTPRVEGFPPRNLAPQELYSAFRESAEIFMFIVPNPGEPGGPPAPTTLLEMIDGKGVQGGLQAPWELAARERYIVTGVLETVRADSEYAYQQHLVLIRRAERGDGLVMSKPATVTDERAVSYRLRNKGMPRPSVFE